MTYLVLHSMKIIDVLGVFGCWALRDLGVRDTHDSRFR